jgi:hypothetical protein
MNPSIMVRTQEGQPLSIDLNTGFIFYDVFCTGVSYRSGDSFITFIDLKIGESFHFGYSDDWTQSDVNRYSNGTHEFMLNYRVRLRGVHKDPGCPSYYNYR